MNLTFSHHWLTIIILERVEEDGLTEQIAEVWGALCSHQLEKVLANATDPVTKYVEWAGIDHLIDVGEISSALKLRTHVKDAWQKRNDLRLKFVKSSQRIAKSIEEAYDRGADDARAVTELKRSEPDDLVLLLKSRVYLTGLYTAVLKTLLTYHASTWKDWDTRMDDLIRDSDIVFRHDFGEAYAAVWDNPELRDQVERDIRAMMVFDVLPGEEADIVAYKREIAGYALKFIWRGATSSATGLGRFDTEITRLYGDSRSSIDRMIASELLLSYAIGTGDYPSVMIPRSLRESRWPYHRCDILDLRYVVTNDKNALLIDESVPEDLRQCAAEHLEVDALRRKLLNTELVRSHTELSKLLQYDSFRQQLNGAKKSLPLALKIVGDVLVKPSSVHRETAIAIIRVMLSHPLWNVTEAVTGEMSDIVSKRKNDENRQLVEDLLRDEWWRVRYGALDVCFNIGNTDRFGSFRRALAYLTFSNERHSRVLGLCGDDFLGWIRDGAGNDDERRAILGEPDIQKMVQGWVQTADDTWLLEYVYLLFRYLHKANLSFRALLPPDIKWSVYLQGDKPFWECGHTEFMMRIEAIEGPDKKSAA